jgi:predicted lipid carrier protein YhbT
LIQIKGSFTVCGKIPPRAMNTLEPILSVPLKLVPNAVHAELLARAFNHLMRGQTLTERLGELDGRAVAIVVEDTGTRVAFRITGNRLSPVSPEQATVRIRGRLAEFLKLATRAEDPDTLFFQRKLAIEGDTETGLHVKNLLDALEYDWDAHFRAVLPGPLAAVATRLRHDLGSFLGGRANSRRTAAPARGAQSPRRPRPAPAGRPAPRETAG